MPAGPQVRRKGRASSLFLAALCSAGLLGSAALAQQGGETGAKLQSVEQELERKRAESERLKARAEGLKKELDALNADLVQAAAKVQTQEFAVLELEEELTRLQAEAAAKERELTAKQGQFAGAVMALASISRTPSEALIVQPLSTEDMVRTAILLRTAVPAIEARAGLLRSDLDSLAFARAQVDGRRAELEVAMAYLQEDEDRLTRLVKRKQALRAEAISKRRAAESQVRKLAEQAKDLRELMAGLAAQPPAPLDDEPGFAFGSITQARGQLPFPVAGGLVGRYGDPLDGGLTAKGITIETLDGAQVISPFDGRVVFSGPFRGYGQLLIIDHGEGYHTLLAGLGRIDAQLGQPVLAGEPVGEMAPAEQGRPILYVELRRGNEPINPLPWLAAGKGKTS